jgi:hypothetical protein
MAVQNSDGTFNGFKISYRGLYTVGNQSETLGIVDGINMHKVFEQLTPEQIIKLLPDMSTLIEVYNKAEQALLEAKVA